MGGSVDLTQGLQGFVVRKGYRLDSFRVQQGSLL